MTVIYAYILYKSKLINKLRDKDHDAVVIGFAARMDIIPVGGIVIKKIPVFDISFERDDGKKYVCTYKQDETSPVYYEVGARVHHFRCTRFPIKYDHGPLEVICPICGKSTKNAYLFHCTYCDVIFYDP